uniref:Cytochrome P450 302a1, mitochondrial-like n=2 Tax=Hirondellea gigas TaxID=1518452 RepID=A0A2P2I3Q6_9CRUS
MIMKRVVSKVLSSRMFKRITGNKEGTEKGVKAFQDIPGPLALPLVGSTWKYILPLKDKYDPERLHEAARQKYDNYGPLVRETLPDGTGLLSVFDPDDIKSFLQQTMQQPDRRSHLALKKYRLDRPHMYSSGGLLPSNGAEWQKLRKASQVIFGKPDAVLGHLPDVDMIMREFVQLLRELRSPQNYVSDLLDLIKMMNLEVMLAVLLDQRYGCVSTHPSPQCEALMRAGSRSTQAILNTDNGPLQLYRYFDTPLYRQLIESQDLIYSEAKKQYERMQKTISSKSDDMSNTENECRNEGGSKQSSISTESDKGGTVKKKTSILEHLCRSPQLGEKDVIGLLCDSLMAGVDTTSYSLAFALYHLSSNKTAQQQLAEEAARLLQQTHGQVTGNVLSKARYTVAVVKESLRLNPISIGIGRVNTHKPIVLRGYHIPAGTTIVSMNQHIGRNPDYFSNCNEFRPERFMSDTRPHSHALLPFGQGSRMCIAQNIAKQTIYTALLHMVYNFDMTWTGGPLDCKVRLINEPDGPLLLTLGDRTRNN